MIEIALPKGHKEPDPLRFGNGLCQTFDFFMMQEIHVLFSHLVEMVFPFDAHSRDFNPAAIFPVTARCRYFPQVDFGIKVRGKGIAMVTAVAVENVNRINAVEFMFFRIGTIRLGHARVESTAKKCHEAGVFKFFTVCPLPAIVKISRESRFLTALFIDSPPLRVIGIFRFVIGCVHVIDAAGQTGIHDGQILIGQSHIHDQIWFFFLDEGDKLVYVISIHLGRRNLRIRMPFQFGSQGIAFGFRTAGKA